MAIRKAGRCGVPPHDHGGNVQALLLCFHDLSCESKALGLSAVFTASDGPESSETRAVVFADTKPAR